MSASKNVIVVGAGVIGLQTAVTLLENGYSVSIIAQHWPDVSMTDGQYTSAWAGAQWRTHAAAGSEAADWDARTYRHWQRLLEGVSAAEQSTIGVSPIKLTEYRVVAPEQTTPWWASLSPSFTHVNAQALPPGVATAMSIDAFVAIPKVYLMYLLNEAVRLGASLHCIQLPTEQGLAGVIASARAVCSKDARGKPLAFINATGLLAKDIVDSDAISPVRGQTLLVRGESKELKTMIGRKPGEVLAIIPRVGTGTTIVGSTRGPGRYDLEPDDRDTQWLTSEARSVAPELFTNGELEILDINVGLRPRREGGARVELETVGNDLVVHAYGHDGAGYQNSVGSAEKVLRLLRSRESRL